MTTSMTIDKNYYVNVHELMNLNLPRPKHRTSILVTGWGEWLPIITVECEK